MKTIYENADMTFRVSADKRFCEWYLVTADDHFPSGTTLIAYGGSDWPSYSILLIL